MIFPDRWERFVAPIPEDERDDILAAFYTRLTSDDEDQRLQAARAWSGWEASIMTLLPDPAGLAEMTVDASAVTMASIECHYAVNGFFLDSDNYLLEQAHNMREVPLRIVQGRYDVICPTISAWELHQALPKSDLRIVPDGSHSPMEVPMVHELVGASEDFKKLY